MSQSLIPTRKVRPEGQKFVFADRVEDICNNVKTPDALALRDRVEANACHNELTVHHLGVPIPSVKLKFADDDCMLGIQLLQAKKEKI